MPSIVMDLDGTLTIEDPARSYSEVEPNWPVVEQVRAYKAKGFKVIIFTARQMRTHAGSVGKINATTLPVAIEWLNRHEIPFDEIHVGKPWPEHDGFYVDDRAIRPEEFLRLSHEEIMTLTGRR
ncbi:capsular biosynthesis protein [Novosphingobium sp. 1949]|uniref:Capsular biosynthesis protein n=1 Tax=Novosphingobium organovorum TaxID=2930092 RepID=A0ABT0BGL2_9SPHN|nr:capsular biosynthesis protein [Novosphingobium organovorum]MCJ2184183.1 capsular biosynthesis protein [Novosphingobium organovorum]